MQLVCNGCIKIWIIKIGSWPCWIWNRILRPRIRWSRIIRIQKVGWKNHLWIFPRLAFSPVIARSSNTITIFGNWISSISFSYFIQKLIQSHIRNIQAAACIFLSIRDWWIRHTVELIFGIIKQETERGTVWKNFLRSSEYCFFCASSLYLAILFMYMHMLMLTSQGIVYSFLVSFEIRK